MGQIMARNFSRARVENTLQNKISVFCFMGGIRVLRVTLQQFGSFQGVATESCEMDLSAL